MSEEVWPPKCPKCGSKKVEYEPQSDYTGGGYADYWYELFCKKCKYEWRSEVKTGLF